MKVFVAVDSFKGSLTSININNSVEKGILEVIPNADVFKLPIADGGEGTCEAFFNAIGGKYVNLKVTGPLFKQVDTEYLIIENQSTVVIELAKSSGLAMLKEEEKNPLKTTSLGLGETIKHALDKGYRKFIIGLGGSSTNDAGIGMCEALGVRFLDENHNQLMPVGESLNKIKDIDFSNLDSRIMKSNFIVASDVDNPLFGENGAAYVFAKQKGASEEMIEHLEQGLINYYKIVSKFKNIDILNVNGYGAAGGIGFATSVFLNAKIQSGIDTILNFLKAEEIIKDSDIVITGEGKIDSQTINGKAPMGVALLAKKYNKPVIAIGGSVSYNIDGLYEKGITSVFSILNTPMTLLEAMDKENAESMVKNSIKEVFRLIKIIKN